MPGCCAAERKEIDDILEPSNIERLRNSREISANPTELSAVGKIGDKFVSTLDIPEDIKRANTARLLFIAEDLDGDNPGDEGVLNVMGKSIKLEPTGDSKSRQFEFTLNPAELKPGKMSVEFLLAGTPGTRGYYVKGIKLVLGFMR